MKDRMPPLAAEAMNERQRQVAKELTEGPRGGVTGPFIPLLRAPELVDRVGKVGEYLRFGSSLAPRVSEFAMVLVSREWTNPFEWSVHVPLALKNGVKQSTLDAVAQGARPDDMAQDESIVYAICDELSRTRGVTDVTYRRAVDLFGENGFIELVTVYGYFVMRCAIINAAHTPPPAGSELRLSAFPP